MKHRQFGYGLQVTSNLSIPGLHDLDFDSPADVEITCGSLPPWVANGEFELFRGSPVQAGATAGENRIFRTRDAEFYLFDYADGTRFLLSVKGDRVWFEWRASYTLEDAATYLLGPIFGFLLRLRGNPGLHASAVEIGTGAIAFVGDGGTGKSTTASWFVLNGHRLVADDHVVLDQHSASPEVVPSYPRIRLWPSSVSILFHAPEALPLLTPNWNKRYLATEAGKSWRAEGSIPLLAIYFLGDRSDLKIDKRVVAIAPSEAFVRLIANSHVNFLLTPSMRATDFVFMSRLARDIPCRLVLPSSDSAQLSDLCGQIIGDATILAG